MERAVTQADLEAGMRRTARVNANRASALTKGCKLTHSIDPIVFYNAVHTGRKRWGCDNVFDEPEFVRDCERFHPEIRPRDSGGGPIRLHFMQPSGISRPVSRLGRVKERYVIRGGKLQRVF